MHCLDKGTLKHGEGCSVVCCIVGGEVYLVHASEGAKMPSALEQGGEGEGGEGGRLGVTQAKHSPRLVSHSLCLPIWKYVSLVIHDAD